MACGVTHYQNNNDRLLLLILLLVMIDHILVNLIMSGKRFQNNNTLTAQNLHIVTYQLVLQFKITLLYVICDNTKAFHEHPKHM